MQWLRLLSEIKEDKLKVGGFRSVFSRKSIENYTCRKHFGCLFGRGFESLRLHDQNKNPHESADFLISGGQKA